MSLLAAEAHVMGLFRGPLCAKVKRREAIFGGESQWNVPRNVFQIVRACCALGWPLTPVGNALTCVFGGVGLVSGRELGLWARMHFGMGSLSLGGLVLILSLHPHSPCCPFGLHVLWGI